MALGVMDTQRNHFGLFRRYFASKFPSHDPDQLLRTNLNEMSDIPENTILRQMSEKNFAPYPNQSSFMLGEWYWCDGSQKSKDSFEKLIDIITSPDFSSADIEQTKWAWIDRKLGSSEEVVDNESLWMDEDPVEDAGWAKTPVSISVPFRCSSPPTSKPTRRRGKTKIPEGHVQTYTIPGFYHRSIISILREKLANEEQFQHFHLEPFELHWQPGNAATSIRLSGELYNSPAFLEAHREVQELPQEPGCVLPRCVAGLMLASDATHLTSFGQTKLWPLYLYFANDSKYRRAKPSLHLCNHVAYFQKVSNVDGQIPVHH